MNTTLTQKLFFRITPTILVTIAAIGALAFHSTTREINNMYDAALINDANVLWRLLQDEVQEAGQGQSKRVDDIDFTMDNQLAINDDADDYADAHMFRAWKDKKIVMFSSTAFPADIAEQKGGFSYVIYKNERWRVYALPIPKTSILIEMGEKVTLRDTLVSNILLNLFFPLIVLVPIIIGLIWFGINNGLGAVRTLVLQIRSRSPDDLAAIPLSELPRDLSPLGKSINQLLEKLEHSLTAERRFSDHAAHQLRTPQARLKLLLQMLSEADSEDERRSLIADLMTSNEKATQLIEQMLSAARVSHQPMKLASVPLYHVVASVVADMGTFIHHKKLEVSLEGNEKAQVHADEDLLRLMIENLVENAIKYTPLGGHIEIIISPNDRFWCLCIRDTGPGIPEDQRQAVFQRFYRIDTPQAEGSGLGLAIVADIVERFSGSTTLDSPESGMGLLVRVLLPRA